MLACNGGLAGMAVAARLCDARALLLAPVAGVVCALVAWLCHVFLHRRSLPAMSLPFVLTTWLLWLCIAPSPAVALLEVPRRVVEILGFLVFNPTTPSGLLLLAGLAARGWRFALWPWITVAPILWGLSLLGVDPFRADLAAMNAMLTVVALVEVFGPTPPSVVGVATAATVLCSLALGPLLHRVGLPQLVLPFNLVVLAALRLASRAQVPAADLRPLRLHPPFFGSWWVSQGVDGLPTHQGEGRHAWDFVVVDGEGRSHRGLGLQLEDYLAWGVPVRAPLGGVVAVVHDVVPDNAPGTENWAQPWGNHVIIATSEGRWVIVAHLQQGSALVRAGEPIETGAVIGRCGSSGRSLEPHIHVQAQSGAYPGAPSLPAVFVACQSSEQVSATDLEGFVPQVGQLVTALV
ncbi:MAG: hypothetical protein EB084_18485 [Proteobacteria bacterium]|nr:hypothetical protein [Pseudomonadota bacterium]